MKPLFSVLLLASGLSQRMGQPKALLRWQGEMTFLEKIITEYLQAGCSKVICTINRDVLEFSRSLNHLQNLTFILNEHPEWSRMHSLQLALQAANESRYYFIQNVDNPFIREDTIREILARRDPQAWCSPVYQQQAGHPVLIPARIAKQIISAGNVDGSLREFLGRFPKKTIGISDDSILRNINTPEDYRIYLSEMQ